MIGRAAVFIMSLFCTALVAKGYSFRFGSDCVILLSLYRECGVAMFGMLDAEFDMILYDVRKKKLVAVRDPIGIYPLFYRYTARAKSSLHRKRKKFVQICDKVLPFSPRHYD